MRKWWEALPGAEKVVLAVFALVAFGVTIGKPLSAIGTIDQIEAKADSAIALGDSAATLANENRALVEALAKSLTPRVDSILETVRSVDRRTCLDAAETKAERDECARR